MLILGLTGSIGMGKSTAAAMLRRMGVAVYCADEAVHALMDVNGAAVAPVAALYPPAFDKDNNRIDRAILGKAAFHDPALMHRLEAILHPLVRQKEKKFLQQSRALRRKLVVLDIPLLFETKGERRMDAVMVVSAPHLIQAQRVLSRANMSAEKLRAILQKQMPDHEKRKRADHIIPTGIGRAHSFAALRKLLISYASG